MPAITKEQLAQKIEQAFNEDSDTQVNPADARKRQAQKIADAVSLFVIGRETTVTGTSATGGAVTGTGIIKE
ncbi:MAG: hypothetical protein REI96_06340 [Flavobacterium nitrogenifigens]|uniref:hypothetical protein n=1 Tax=Flavobacterium nitrogenifigens TaxID=1617283 RepID=UPI00280A3732|nr:hypothetical protein [Flavobacterium nitrogenifigens]MDQ8012046.1 hypothetical protein [Flavobacterium nitrogenifigens]